MSIDANQVRTELREFLAETFFLGDEINELGDDESFMEKGIIDSTGVLEMTSYLEEKHGFSISDEEMTPANLDTINNLIGFIEKKTS